MSNIRRSLKNVTGDLTVVNGDVVVSDPTKGIVMEDNVADDDRLQTYDDGGVKTIKVEQV